MKLSETSSLQLFPIFQRWQNEGKADRADQTAQYFASEFVKQFEPTVVLARVYISIPFKHTLSRHQKFASDIANKAKEPIGPSTSLLCLAGSAGRAQEWNSPAASKGHVAIPLTSPQFVSSLPMVSELFSQLGLLPHYFPQKGAASARTEAKRRSLFFVSDAQTSRDTQNRFIIPARDFVNDHRVSSVFGGAERYDENVAVCFLVFTNEVLPQAQVESFSAVSHLLIAVMGRALARNAYFAS